MKEKKVNALSQIFQSVTHDLVNGAESPKGISRKLDTQLERMIFSKEKLRVTELFNDSGIFYLLLPKRYVCFRILYRE